MNLPPKTARIPIAGFVLLTLAGCANLVPSDRDRTSPSATVYFSPELLLGHVCYLASDEIGGRDPGTPGMKRAAQYIADQFAASGIEPAGDDGTYFQPLPVGQAAELTDQTRFDITGAEVDNPVPRTDCTPFSWSTDDAFEGQVVFVGYGISNPDEDYDDYAGVDVAGKVVLMLRREPSSWQDGDGYTRLARFRNKVGQAKERGALAVLIANQKRLGNGPDRLMPLGNRVRRRSFGLPAFHVKRALANKLLAAGGLDSLEVMQEKLDADAPTHCSAPLPGVRINARAGIRTNEVTSPNVIGLIHGSGPQRDEYVVLGAHYDHMGKMASRSMFGRPGAAEAQVHNGADDNASGTAGLIELGRVLARRSDLNRSVMLIAFTAEERGMLGSEHFCEHPTVPVDRIVAMLNMDMIGRMTEDSNSLWVYGTGTGQGLAEVVHRCAAAVGLEVVAEEAGSGHSDDRSFHKHSIPALHFFTGVHADMHRPTDDADKINEQDAVRVVHLLYDITRELVDNQPRPTYCYVAGRAKLGGSPTRAVMGVWPDPSDEGKTPGILVGRTAPNGPAEQGGIRTGDRIVEVAGQPTNSLGDYRAATEGKVPGDTVEVVVERGGERVTLSVTLAAG